MKFFAVLPVALAALSVAQAFDASLESPHVESALEPRLAGDVHMTAAELDAAGISFDPGFNHGQMLPVSTKCAAHPRTDVAGCPSVGHLKHPSKRLFIYGIKFQRCANTCTCRFKTSNDCQAFAWHEGKKKPGRGRCIIYSEAISDMGFTTAPRADGDYPERTFYNRSCWHKGAPYPTNIQTDLPAAATPVARRVRRDEIRGDVVAALERV